jgi:hypothetical protein
MRHISAIIEELVMNLIEKGGELGTQPGEADMSQEDQTAYKPLKRINI